MMRYTAYSFFFFNDTATTEIYTLSLHDALPIWNVGDRPRTPLTRSGGPRGWPTASGRTQHPDARTAGCDHPPTLQRLLRSEEHTSELQSRQYLVCRLLLEKKKKENIRCSLDRTT